MDEITLNQMVDFLEHPGKYETKMGNVKTNSLIRQINDEMSIRKGKYGAYIFYKRTNMTEPQFLKIRGFPLGYATCSLELLEDWIYRTHNLPRNFR
jgi:topoisomerase IA-like protein